MNKESNQKVINPDFALSKGEKVESDEAADEEAHDADQYAAAIVPQTDDPSIPTFTFRVLLLGTFWCIALGAANAILSFRTNPFAVDAMLATLLSYPLGIFLSKILPTKQLNLFGWSCSFNPVCIFLSMCNLFLRVPFQSRNMSSFQLLQMLELLELTVRFIPSPHHLKHPRN